MDLRKSKYILPNLFTLASIFFGMLAVSFCLDGGDDAFRRAAIAILVAAVADGLDGRVARATRTATRFGVQLDSLADVLSFGMAPAILAYAFSLRNVGGDGLLGVLVAFVYAACGALRLARFNLLADKASRPSSVFLGLPIPGGAGLVALAVWVATDFGLGEEARALMMLIGLPAIGGLMVSTIRYQNFKHVRLGWTARILLLVLIALVILAAIYTRTSVVLLALACIYGALGPVEWILRLILRRRPAAEAPSEQD
jgi:CDP-diacylglycerol--serine O-phosphatidyltransferase